MQNHWKFCYQLQEKLLLDRLRSADTPRRLMITHTIESCWIPSQNKVEWLSRYRSRSKVATCDTPSPCSRASDHLYKYGKTPSRTVDATERTRFSRPRPNDLEDIGQGQRSLYATHPLILEIICATYGNSEVTKMSDVIQKYFCNVIFEKNPRWAFYPDGRFAPHYPINVKTVH